MATDTIGLEPTPALAKAIEFSTSRAAGEE